MHKELPLISLIKKKHEKSDKDSAKIKLRRDSTSETSDLYEIKMAFFEHVKPEEFFLFVQNF